MSDKTVEGSIHDSSISESIDNEVKAAESKPSRKDESRISGKVKWFNVKYGYGFITRDDNHEDVFVRYSGITRQDHKPGLRSLGDGEQVEFNLTATSVTGPDGKPVVGHALASRSRIPRRSDSRDDRPPRDSGRSRDAFVARSSEYPRNNNTERSSVRAYTTLNADHRGQQPLDNGRNNYRTVYYSNTRIPKSQQQNSHPYDKFAQH